MSGRAGDGLLVDFGEDLVQGGAQLVGIAVQVRLPAAPRDGKPRHLPEPVGRRRGNTELELAAHVLCAIARAPLPGLRRATAWTHPREVFGSRRPGG